MLSSSATHHLIGIGVGPGDPELVTLKAVAALKAADVVLVPVTESRSETAGRAEQIVLAVTEDQVRIQRIPFSMQERSGVGPKRRESWQASVEVALHEFSTGAARVAFATVGDPSVYSTFSYLAAGVKAELADLSVEVIPGITAMQALAAAAATPLVEGREVLCLFPNTAGPERLAEVLDVADSVVVYKGGRKLPQVLAELRARDRQAVIGTEISLPEQAIAAMQPDSHQDAALPYFSTVLSVPGRTTPGGQL